MDLLGCRFLVAAVAAASALAVAGCGGDEETDTAAQGTGGTATEEADTGAGATGDDGAAATVDVDAVEFAFQPSNPTVEEDGQVSIELANEGELPHALTIEELDESTETIEGGQSDTLTTEIDSGEYTIFCPVGDHREQGMEGTLTVGGGDGGGDDSGGASDDDSGTDDDSGGDDSGSAGSAGGY